MNELINITLNENQEPVVSARQLHKSLEVKTRFSQWVEQNFKMFKENEDFTSVVGTTLVNNGAVRKLQDYAVSVRMAEHLAMMSKTNKGHEVREYFIQVEKVIEKEVIPHDYKATQDLNKQLLGKNKDLADELDSVKRSLRLKEAAYEMLEKETSEALIYQPF